MAMNGCWIYITVERYDGAAEMEMYAEFDRVPVAGDCVLAFPKWESDSDVKSVCLLPDGGCWVTLDKDERDVGEHYSDDEFWDAPIEQSIREAIDGYIENGWEVRGSLKLLWHERHEWIEAGNFAMEYYPLGELKTITADVN